MEVTKLLLICAAPRTGSNLLCEALRTSGLAGRPSEYFHKNRRAQNITEWGISGDLRSYASGIVDRTKSANGVVSSKLFPRHLALLEEDGFLPGPERLSQLIEAFDAKEAILVRLARENELDQAISLVRASQTKQWRSNNAAIADPQYDGKAINKALRKIKNTEQEWEREFKISGLSPQLSITYEHDLGAQHHLARTCGRIFELLDVDDWPEAAKVVLAASLRTERQADRLNAEWKHRFEQETGR